MRGCYLSTPSQPDIKKRIIEEVYSTTVVAGPHMPDAKIKEKSLATGYLHRISLSFHSQAPHEYGSPWGILRLMPLPPRHRSEDRKPCSRERKSSDIISTLRISLPLMTRRVPSFCRHRQPCRSPPCSESPLAKKPVAT